MSIIGKTIAIEFPIEGEARVVRGSITSQEERDGHQCFRVELEDAEGTGGQTVLFVDERHAQNLREGGEFGCCYFLPLAEEQSPHDSWVRAAR